MGVGVGVGVGVGSAVGLGVGADAERRATLAIHGWLYQAGGGGQKGFAVT